MERIDVAKKMKKLIQKLHGGFNGVDIPIRPECDDQWHYNYAIVQGFYYDVDVGDSEYATFDGDRFIRDFKKFLMEFFGVSTVYHESNNDSDTPKVGDLVVRLYRQAQEIEVYYQTYSEKDCLIWWVPKADLTNGKALANRLKNKKLPAYLEDQLIHNKVGKKKLWVHWDFPLTVIEEAVGIRYPSEDATPLPKKSIGIVFHKSDLSVVRTIIGASEQLGRRGIITNTKLETV